MSAFVGTTLVLVLIGSVLLASRDLWNMEARTVGRILRSAGVPGTVVVSETALAGTKVGAATRSGHRSAAHAPLVRLGRVPRPRRPTPAGAAAIALLSGGACAVLTLAPRVPLPVKGLVLVCALAATGTAAYLVWSPLPPLEVGNVLVDWRTSALVPVCLVSLLYALDAYPLPGSFALKTAWLLIAVAVTAGFSTLRLAVVAAGYEAFGPPAFLPLYLAAGSFWDLVPGIAVLALTHATLALAPELHLPRAGGRRSVSRAWPGPLWRRGP